MLSHIARYLKGAAALCVFSGVVFGFAPEPMAQPEPKKMLTLDDPARLEFYWQSLEPSKEAHTKELSKLYFGLNYLRKNGWSVLTETTALDPGDPYVVSLSASRKLHDGVAFPPGLKSLLCELNPNICNDTCAREVGGSGKDFCHSDDARIVLPKVELRSIIVPHLYKKKKVDTLEGVVVRDRQGCSQIDDACKRMILNINGGNDAVLNSDYAGFLRVPTKTYEARFVVVAPPGATAVYALGGDKDTRALLGLTTDSVTYLRDTLKDALPNLRLISVKPIPGPHFGGITDNHAASKELGNQNKTGGAQAGGECDPDVDSLPIDRLTMLKMIKHPDVVGGPKPMRRNIIALFDGWINKEHCELKLAEVINKREITLNNGWQNQCGSFERGLHPDDVHATHLAGLIATKKDAGRVAVNSNARLYSVDVNPGDFSTGAQAPVLAAGADIRDFLSIEDVSVANLSWFYTELTNLQVGELDQVQASIDNSVTLFVTAAGNHRARHMRTDSCNIFPACFGFKNIISTVAASRTIKGPSLLNCSNHGTKHDVIAPGGMLWSSYPGNARNEASGTSQAAAVVSGAASLLKAKCQDMKAPAIAARLILTSDFYGKIDRNAAMGGMINLQKALRTEVQQFEYLDKYGNVQTLLANGKDGASGFEETGLRIMLMNGFNSHIESTQAEHKKRSMDRILRITKVISDIPSQHEYVIFGISNERINDIPDKFSFHRLHGGKIRFIGNAASDGFRFKGKNAETGDLVDVVIPPGEEHRILDFVRRDYAGFQCRGERPRE